jgi:hypothetical protein
MRDIIFNVDFHLALFSVLSVLVCLLYIFAQTTNVRRKLKKLDLLKSMESWSEVPVKIIKKGFYIEYDSPNKYTRNYNHDISEVEVINAASFEFEKLKERVRRRKIESNTGDVSIHYREDGGKLKHKVSFSNNSDINYDILMSIKDRATAFKLKSNPKVMVISIPDNKEVKAEAKRLYKGLIKKSSIYLFLSISISVAALYF